MSLNKVQLIGHLGKDPEIKQVGDSKVANFSLATSETYKKQLDRDWETHNFIFTC